MAKTYWDPGNLLLQIDYYGNDGELQCVGRTRFNVRCKWGIEGQAYANVQSRLAEMAKKRPSEIELSELPALAGLCLCNQYHQNQRADVVRHWRAVVGRAAGHCAGACRNDSATVKAPAQLTRELTPEDEDMIYVRLQLLRAQKELNLSNAAKIESQNELAKTQDNLMKTNREYQSIRQSVAKLHLDKLGLEAANKDLTELQERTEARGQAKVATLQQHIARITDEAQITKTRLEDTLNLNVKLEENNKRLQGDQETLRRKWEKLRSDHDQRPTETEKWCSEKSLLTGQVERLQNNLDTATQERLRLATEVETITHALQQSRIDVQGGRNAISGLNAQTGNLSQRIRSLEENIAGCSLHNLGTRINHLKRKLLRSSE